MAARGLSNPTISIQGVPLSIVPNSFKYVLGRGTTTVRSASAGGFQSESVHTENAEERVGKMMFDVYVTPENQTAFSVIKRLTGLVVVTAIQVDIAPVVLQGASLTNDPEWNAGADGVVSFEFAGDPIAAI